MSTESGQPGPGRAVPSFGDLFDDPEVPEAAETAAAPAPVPETATATEPDPVPEPIAAASADEATSVAVEPEPVAFVAPLVEPEPLAEGPAYDDDLAAALAAPSSAAAVAAAAARPVDTGRLYRSAGAEGPATLDAIPAIDPEYLARRDARLAEEARAAEAAAAKQAKRTSAAADGGAGLTWTGVSVVMIAATVLVGFADALINNSLGVLTGIALLVSSVYSAFTVRRSDIWAPVVMAPLAFVVAALTAGQLTLDGAGSLLVREGYMLLKTLAQGAPWVIGTTLVCLVIVLVRRNRAPAATPAI